MRVTTDENTALVDLEGYGDLLAVRALPDYRFVGPASVQVAASDLEGLGVATGMRAAVEVEVASHLFDYQAWVTARAFERERLAVFMLTGLGKTLVELEWSRLVARATGSGRPMGTTGRRHPHPRHEVTDIGSRGIVPNGLGRYARHMVSADSLAWSYNARRHPPLAGHADRRCANCPSWALRWHERATRRARVQQLDLWEARP